MANSVRIKQGDPYPISLHPPTTLPHYIPTAQDIAYWLACIDYLLPKSGNGLTFSSNNLWYPDQIKRGVIVQVGADWSECQDRLKAATSAIVTDFWSEYHLCKACSGATSLVYEFAFPFQPELSAAGDAIKLSMCGRFIPPQLPGTMPPAQTSPAIGVDPAVDAQQTDEPTKIKWREFL